MPHRRLAGAASIVVLGFLLAAGIGSAAAAPSGSPAAFRAEATAICKTLETRINKAQASGQAVAFLEASLSDGRSYRASVAALRAPASLAAIHQKLVQTIGAELARLAVLIPRYSAGAITLSGLLNDPAENRLDNEENALWKEAGVPACAT